MHAVALVHSGKGDVESARAWFQACLDTKNFFVNGYYQSQMFIRLIDQGKLPAKSRQQNIENKRSKHRGQRRIVNRRLIVGFAEFNE